MNYNNTKKTVKTSKKKATAKRERFFSLFSGLVVSHIMNVFEGTDC